MSEYFKSLPPVAKERYLSKVRCLNLKEEDDPYLSSKFVEDLICHGGHLLNMGTFLLHSTTWSIYTATVATVEECANKD